MLERHRATLRIGLTLLAVSIGTVATRPALASLCLGDPGFGSCHVQVTPHTGEFPYAITVNVTEGRVIVVDLYSGLFYKYLASSITSTPLTLSAPFGSAQYTGIAWHSVEDQLYWVVDDGGGQILAVTDSGGLLVVTGVPIASPAGGLVGDITYNPGSDSFWGADITADIFFEFLSDGTATGNVIASPATAYPFSPTVDLSGAAYGSGITAVFDASTSTYSLDVTTGRPYELSALHVERLNTDGTPVGLSFALKDATSTGLGWITGIAFSESGSETPPVATEFIIDGINNQLFEVPIILPDRTDVAALACVANASNNVGLTWINTDDYDSIQIRRDGSIIAGLTGDAESYTDVAVIEEGTHTYSVEVRLTSSDPFEESASCDVVLGPGRYLNSVRHEGDNPLAITVVESTDRVYVVDIYSGTTYRYLKDLSLVDSIASPFGTNATPGLAWNSDSDTLLWLDGATMILRETDLDGVAIGADLPLLYDGGAVGDITYAPATATYWASDIVMGVFFEFDATGTPTGNQFDAPAGAGNSITAVGSTGTFDLFGQNPPSDVLDVVLRTDPTGSVTASYDLLPTSLSGFVNGIAWTEAGSDGEVAEYIVANDTNVLIEVTLLTQGAPFVRADANDDGSINLIDATYTLFYLFAAGTPPSCFDAADSDDNGTIELTDVVYTLDYIFAGGAAPPAPLGACDIDVTEDTIGCDGFESCL